MITPNLASRPFLNTRPVWLVVGAAGLLAVILAALNLRFFLATNSEMEAELARRDELQVRHGVVETEVRADVDALRKVPWRTLEGKVVATNLILNEHAFSWLQMLDDIEQVMPWDVRMTNIAPAVSPEEVILSLEVVAQTREALLTFLDNLLAVPRFSDPTPISERTPEQATAAGYFMTLRVTYHPPGEAP